jgi:hypothetical protein
MPGYDGNILIGDGLRTRAGADLHLALTIACHVIWDMFIRPLQS